MLKQNQQKPMIPASSHPQTPHQPKWLSPLCPPPSWSLCHIRAAQDIPHCQTLTPTCPHHVLNWDPLQSPPHSYSNHLLLLSSAQPKTALSVLMVRKTPTQNLTTMIPIIVIFSVMVIGCAPPPVVLALSSGFMQSSTGARRAPAQMLLHFWAVDDGESRMEDG